MWIILILIIILYMYMRAAAYCISSAHRPTTCIAMRDLHVNNDNSNILCE